MGLDSLGSNSTATLGNTTTYDNDEFKKLYKWKEVFYPENYDKVSKVKG